MTSPVQDSCTDNELLFLSDDPTAAHGAVSLQYLLQSAPMCIISYLGRSPAVFSKGNGGKSNGNCCDIYFTKDSYLRIFAVLLVCCDLFCRVWTSSWPNQWTVNERHRYDSCLLIVDSSLTQIQQQQH